MCFKINTGKNVNIFTTCEYTEKVKTDKKLTNR